VRRRHPDEDPEIPDWNEQEGWRELWELDQQLWERPESTSRMQRSEEGWD
jgi:hypothetical protein